MEFHKEIQSEHFGKSLSLHIEGSSARFISLASCAADRGDISAKEQWRSRLRVFVLARLNEGIMLLIVMAAKRPRWANCWRENTHVYTLGGSCVGQATWLHSGVQGKNETDIVGQAE